MIQLLQGDCCTILPTLPAESVQCCVTSPPYWGLRDYGTAAWEGGRAECDHKRFNGYEHGLHGTVEAQDNGKFFKDVCAKCGARRIDSQLGLEQSPDEYVANMVQIFREVWRVLKPDGTLFLNLGDSYAGGKQGRDDGGYNGNGSFHGQPKHNETKPVQRKPPIGFKPKDLCGIPWRVAFALQELGWYLRSDIIWHKPNPMPESVTDRPTKSHEYIFLLSKAEHYFWDAEAIREPHAEPWRGNGEHESRNGRTGGNIRTGIDWTVKERQYNPLGRNKRTVWTIATQPYADAHFATFPEEIPKLCILAGTKPGDTVLDPFGGSGTTGKVAIELGRRVILIELSAAYMDLARERTNVTPGLFCNGVADEPSESVIMANQEQADWFRSG